jgi:hypothetical protein
MRYLRGSLHNTTWLDRAVVLSVALLLALQLMFSGQHKDDLAGYGDNCPSCVFAHHLPSGLPDVEPVVRVRAATFRYQIADAVFYRAPSRVSFLIPESQAPPRA